MFSVDWLTKDLWLIETSHLEKWIKSVIEEESLNQGELAVVLCTDEELLEYNIKHLAHDYYTDIITFDYREGELISGDLYISVDRVKENAVVLGVDFAEEFSRVVVHGVLHLCGYLDKTVEESVMMRIKEEYYLNKLKGFM